MYKNLFIYWWTHSKYYTILIIFCGPMTARGPQYENHYHTLWVLPLHVSFPALCVACSNLTEIRVAINRQCRRTQRHSTYITILETRPIGSSRWFKAKGSYGHSTSTEWPRLRRRHLVLRSAGASSYEYLSRHSSSLLLCSHTFSYEWKKSS